jgi:mRNA interferase MazF
VRLLSLTLIRKVVLKTHGEILCEQLKSLDYNARNWQFAEAAPEDIFERVLFILDKIIGK